ncbi:YqhV family protein [Paenibacillus beijingensis]|uniref:Membrane protein n=1 Tax=Paenibacillus beijingensis TaxID=1126833 RepID=A0A0D5NQK9_9BACL|nr:YqhV family protein [Paenibacillus beijingensis]AJY77267.1 membrane protein [Paenibacillus beijingensis]
MLDKIVLSMASLRILSGSIEILAALLMLRLNQIDKAMIVNSSLAFVGPIILISTTTIGLAGLSDKLSPSKLIWVAAGIGCLLIGILKK